MKITLRRKFWTNYYHAVHMFVNYFFTKYVNNAVFVCIDMSFVMLTFSVLFRCLCTGTWNMIEWNKWYEIECVQYCFLITTIMLDHNLLLFSYIWVPTVPNHTPPNPTYLPNFKTRSTRNNGHITLILLLYCIVFTKVNNVWYQIESLALNFPYSLSLIMSTRD